MIANCPREIFAWIFSATCCAARSLSTIGNLNGMYRIIVCKRRRLHEQFSGADRGDEGCARVKTRAKCENGDERDGGNPSRQAAAGDTAVCEEVARAVRNGGSRRVTARLSGQRELSE